MDVSSCHTLAASQLIIYPFLLVKTELESVGLLICLQDGCKFLETT